MNISIPAWKLDCLASEMESAVTKAMVASGAMDDVLFDRAVDWEHESGYTVAASIELADTFARIVTDYLNELDKLSAKIAELVNQGRDAAAKSKATFAQK